MTTYQKLLAVGRGMSQKEITDSLKGLARDARFAALLAVIDGIKSETADVACDMNYADRKGTLEHAAGVRFGLRMLEGRLMGVTDPPKRTGERKREEEE